MSLSPRPHIFIIIIWSFGSFGAIFFTYAKAWLGSKAGIIPSFSQHNLNASNDSSSVIDTYSTLPISCKYECSGPIPG